MKRGEAKKLALANGCELFSVTMAPYGWTLWELDGQPDGEQEDFSARQLRELTPEQLIASCKRITEHYTGNAARAKLYGKA